MKIAFNIKYRAPRSERISVIIRGDKPQRVDLRSQDWESWQGEYNCPTTKNYQKLEYSYQLSYGDKSRRSEILSTPHIIELHKGTCQEYVANDVWRDLPQSNYRYSAAFNTSEQLQPQVLSNRGGYVTFRALAPALRSEGLRLGLLGSCEPLGEWREEQMVSMCEISTNYWSISLPLENFPINFEYKFVTIDIATERIVEWENCDNHQETIDADSFLRGVNYNLAECEVKFPRGDIRIAGSAIPVFSLRSEGGCGIGDFGDLKQYISWASESGQRVVQILPINDTTINNTWQDSYPYNSISIYAFHPIYIDLRALPRLKDRDKLAQFEAQRVELNNLKEIDYERVNTLKREYLRAIYQQEGAKNLHSREFKKFYNHNSHWLLPYAAFSYLRDINGSAKFGDWKRYSIYNKEDIEALCSPESEVYDDIAYYYYVQYLLHIQLLEAADWARSIGVILKGDIPIGISRESVEAWIEPHYFNMNGQAGAPPDAFSQNGQNWGFPTYNWDIMQRDNYLWWRKRFEKMSEYFTAYRIDHILGFFRIWEIPQHSVHGLLGQFTPSLPMSRAEIERWGLKFQIDLMTEPFINDEMIDEIFGERCDEVRQKYLKHLHHDRYAMREEFATQRLIEAHFAGESDSESLRLKESLYSLVSNVLFVVDSRNEGGYHPRIGVQMDYVYKQLSESQKEIFNRLYDHYYYERHNEFWYTEAMKKLPVLTCSNSMLVCGEDLGMVPDCVPPVMNQLQIISLEIERMPKQIGEEFGNPAHYPYNSVCTIGTHDMSTLRGWWQEDEAQRRRYFYNELHHYGDIPYDAPHWICADVIRRHLNSPSMMTILTWQDWLSIDESLRNPDIESERINIPANPRHYWRWRMHISLEQLRREYQLNENIKMLICRSGRSV